MSPLCMLTLYENNIYQKKKNHCMKILEFSQFKNWHKSILFCYFYFSCSYQFTDRNGLTLASSKVLPFAYIFFVAYTSIRFNLNPKNFQLFYLSKYLFLSLGEAVRKNKLCILFFEKELWLSINYVLDTIF